MSHRCAASTPVGGHRRSAASRRRSPLRARRGTVYLLVLAVTTIVAAMGLGALVAQRSHARVAARVSDASDARAAAASAIEYATHLMASDEDWKSTYGQGFWFKGFEIGRARASVEVEAADDGAWNTSDPEQAVALIATARAGEATQRTRVVIEGERGPPRPIEALRRAGVAHKQLRVRSGDELQADGAPVASNGHTANNGHIGADLETDSYSGSGSLAGELERPTEDKWLPGIDDLDYYVERATELADVSEIRRAVLSANANPYGATNKDGIYLIRSPSSDVVISESRIVGTLVVLAPGQQVRITEAALLQPGAPAMPTLIVDGDLEVALDPFDSEDRLDEDAADTNFNPPGTPYDGTADTDEEDAYPSVLRGLVHATGEIEFERRASVDGVVLAGDSMIFRNRHVLAHDDALADDPPPAYRTPGPVRYEVVPDRTARVVSDRTP